MTEPTLGPAEEMQADPEGNSLHDVWETQDVPGWQAGFIRLARPALLWALGVVTMGFGCIFVGVVEAFTPGAGVRMVTAMAGLLKAYPDPLYYLVAFLFGGQAMASIIRAWRGQ